MVHLGGLVLFTCSLWTFIVPLNVAVGTEVRDRPQVIGSSQPIMAVLGEDVILPCHLEPKFNVEGFTVEWSNPDLKPDPADQLSRVEYVHLYRDRREVPDMKIRSYVMRTALFTDDLKDGNISLKILNVTLSDQGRYRCFIPKLKSQVKESIVQLVVAPRSDETSTTETQLDPRNLPNPDDPDDETDVEVGRHHVSVLIPMSVCVLLILAAGVGALLHKQNHQKLNHQEV
ncbi:butyrophilin-like protein 2 [Anoplopoma fimbria]|uniref:butyrophilin-like protein 2 n=1 Tax=Anoplopoma fimbria TaxID=229290 RepID=UPI0023EA90D9|nr:butyrophilin-like protein 2 [Anoplopoma fimbria]